MVFKYKFITNISHAYINHSHYFLPSAELLAMPTSHTTEPRLGLKSITKNDLLLWILPTI